MIFAVQLGPPSEAERQTVVRAYADLSGTELHGARAHLRSAGSLLTEGKYGDSIRESMQAVEAVARTLDPSAATLAPALAKLEKKMAIHPALKWGFGKLYGYTSDEKGIRHPLLDEPVATVILVAGILCPLATFAGLVSARIDMPLLLVFIGVGMLAGEDGPGGIRFTDLRTAYLIGSLALAGSCSKVA